MVSAHYRACHSITYLMGMTNGRKLVDRNERNGRIKRKTSKADIITSLINARM